MEAALTSNHSDLPVRFIWLNLFYRLAHYPADDRAVVNRGSENAEGHRQEFLNDLKTLVGLTRDEAAGCKDPRRVRWEISNACAIRDWDFAGSLYTRLEEMVSAEQKSQVLAMHGRQEFSRGLRPSLGMGGDRPQHVGTHLSRSAYEADELLLISAHTQADKSC
jgi:hypothetical protein